jgi:poly-gamma-glutamate synthesis protein (capsule biosynthesis protein)
MVAQAPAILDVGTKGRVLVFSFGFESSGITRAWLAREDRPGVNLLSNLSDSTIQRLRTTIASHRCSKDIVVASIHWGGNWGYTVAIDERRFAHRLIDVVGVDIVHGHSSHHVKGIEVYRNRPIFYGCGDFATDYEGIRGYEEFRGDLALMYFASLDASSGRLLELRLTPLQARRMRLTHPSASDVAWLQDKLNRKCERLGTKVNRTENDSFSVHWNIKRASTAVSGVP